MRGRMALDGLLLRSDTRAVVSGNLEVSCCRFLPESTTTNVWLKAR